EGFCVYDWLRIEPGRLEERIKVPSVTSVRRRAHRRASYARPWIDHRGSPRGPIVLACKRPYAHRAPRVVRVTEPSARPRSGHLSVIQERHGRLGPREIMGLRAFLEGIVELVRARPGLTHAFRRFHTARGAHFAVRHDARHFGGL